MEDADHHLAYTAMYVHGGHVLYPEALRTGGSATYIIHVFSGCDAACVARSQRTN